MLWVVLLILAVIAFFGYKGLHNRHISRCRYDERTQEHVPESISEQAEQKAFHDRNAAMSENMSADNNGMPGERVKPQRGGPSLLYAEHRVEDSSEQQTEHISQQTKEGSQSLSSESDSNQLQQESADSMDFTAETTTLSSDEVGIPANNSDYDQVEEQNNDQTANQINTDTTDITQDKHTDTVYQAIDTDETSKNIADSAQISAYSNNNNKGIAAAGVAAAAAGIGIAASAQQSTQQTAQHSVSHSTQPNTPASHDHHESAQFGDTAQHTGVASHTAQPTTASAEGIDLELGDTTLNDPDDLTSNETDENDELLDFGDLTADISEMLKELNLREADSPRLEINQDEFAQLKTGEPGEVKPEKIENVADKLRNMLQ